jgi:hypothetical protein
MHAGQSFPAIHNMYPLYPSIIIIADSGCHKQEFYSAWYNSIKCNCCSTNSEAVSPGTHTTTIEKTPPTTSHNTLNCSKLANTLGILVAALAVLLVLVISGWVWTCWMMKKLRQQIKSLETNKYVRLMHARGKCYVVEL